jgi:hypothetical protein
MSEDHQTIQELLAAHALHALDEADAARAEELLISHLPTCAECRTLLDGFEAAVADLALATRPAPTPVRLRVRLQRQLDPGHLPWWWRGAASAVAVALVAGLGLWNAHLTRRVTDVERRQADTTEVLAAVSHPMSRVVPLSAESAAGTASVAVSYVPGRRMLYLFGSLPEPRDEHVYEVWLYRGDQFVPAGLFRPQRGTVLVRLPVDARGFDRLLITEEPESGSARPSSRHVMHGSFG